MPRGTVGLRGPILGSAQPLQPLSARPYIDTGHHQPHACPAVSAASRSLENLTDTLKSRPSCHALEPERRNRRQLEPGTAGPKRARLSMGDECAAGTRSPLLAATRSCVGCPGPVV